MGGQRAQLALELAFDGARTRPRRALATPPLQLSRARYDDPACPDRLHLTLVHLGGVLAGDSYELTVDLDAGAEAVVAAAAATQIYTMAGGCADQQTLIRAAPGSALCWMPGPQILFAGASFSQSTRVELGAGAFVMLGDALVPGRLAHGERWQFDRYEGLLEIVGERGQLLACERALVEPGRRSPAAPGVMGDFGALGSLWLLGAGVDAEGVAGLVGARGGQLSAAVLPGGCGVLVRALGAGLAATREALQRCYVCLASRRLVPPGPGPSWWT